MSYNPIAELVESSTKHLQMLKDHLKSNEAAHREAQKRERDTRDQVALTKEQIARIEQSIAALQPKAP